MAVMAKVNKAIKSAYPNLEVEAVRGCGYVYFTGGRIVDEIDSVYSHPVNTSTEDMIRMCLDEIEYYLNNY